MSSEKEQCRNNILTKKFWMFSSLLLSLMVQNAESVETSFRESIHHIEISGFAFVPKQLKVKAGDTITWINKDIVPHNVIESIDQRIISPELAAGETYSFVVKRPLAYQCGLHPPMKGELLVTLMP